MTEGRVGSSANNTDDISDISAVVLAGNFPLVVKHILSFLPAKQLNTAARVCKQWSQLAKEIRECRRSLAWFMAIPDEEEDSTSLADKIKIFLDGLWSEPHTVVAFMSSALYEEQLVLPNQTGRRQHCSRAAKCVKVELEQYIEEKLPSQCSLFGSAADGAVGTEWRSTRSVEVEGEKALTMLLLPHLPGLDILSFTMDIYSSETNWHMAIDELESRDVDITTISGIPPDKNVRAVLFFCDEPFCPPEIGHSILNKYKDAIVAGGYVDNLVVKPKPKSSDTSSEDSFPTILCLAFCGDNLRVWSVIIRESVSNAEDAEKQIRQLKTSEVSEEKSFAFMFACVGRGEGLYLQRNVESDAFHKVFPRTPLFGFFGNGEIGFNSLPGAVSSGHKSNIESKGERILPKLYHAYTTIICLFSVV
ncbi:F-box only protein 22-like [Liolophura sinensis]|uniref:F-box only protein 22-like n=1 Tax=Liolophura sinensis TaxID=3198878 RepID=UPI003158F6B6